MVDELLGQRNDADVVVVAVQRDEVRRHAVGNGVGVLRHVGGVGGGLDGGCGGRMVAASGVITSPNYPNMYDDSDDCAWLLEVDENHVVSFTFEDFDVEPHSNCSYDYVALYDGANTSSPLIIQHCGAVLPVPNLFVSTGNQMYVRLKADGSVPTKGFKANFTRVKLSRDLEMKLYILQF